jgi:hypothetical protein
VVSKYFPPIMVICQSVVWIPVLGAIEKRRLKKRYSDLDILEVEE